MAKRVLAGMRPTSRLHIGNYLGSAKGMIALQDDPVYDTFYCVVDLHAMTTPYDAKTLAENTRQVVLDYLAVGLDPEKSAIFIQSDLADIHTQMMFYLSSVVSVARMQHLPTFKEKVKQHPKNVTMALLNYPVLMAADILLYKAEKVPVGLDQEPHLEVAREIARKMNAEYSTDFPEPKRFTMKGGEYIPSLSGEGKMSKSVEGSFISLTDNLDEIKAKIAGVPTDSGVGEVRSEESGEKKYFDKSGTESQGVSALMSLISLFQEESTRSKYEQEYSKDGVRYSELKNELAEAIYEELRPIQERRRELEAKPEYIEEVLEKGAAKARKVAEITLKEIKEKLGINRT